MNSSELSRRPIPCADEQVLSELLAQLRLRFYSNRPPAVFQRDRRRLLAALSWPAH